MTPSTFVVKVFPGLSLPVSRHRANQSHALVSLVSSGEECVLWGACILIWVSAHDTCEHIHESARG